MGNYIFTTKVLIDAIRADADDDTSDHDMGGNIIPNLVADGMAAVYDFSDNEVPGATERDHGYWRDVGTLDAFYDAHMDLVSVHPVFNLYNKRWPIRGESETCPGQVRQRRFGAGIGCRCGKHHLGGLGAQFGAVQQRRGRRRRDRRGQCADARCPGWCGAVVRRAILDKNAVVGPGEMVGVDLERDRERFAISGGGVVAVGKGVWI